MFFRISLYFLVPLKSEKIDNLLKKWLKDNKVAQGLHPVFIWSLVDGRERYYVHLLDKKGNKRYFVKITIKKEDYKLLENEKNNLKYFENAKSFSVPKVMNFTKSELYCSLITDYINEDYFLNHPENNKFPAEIAKEIAGKVKKISLHKVLKKYDFKKDNDFNKFIKTLDNNIYVSVARAHGDFGSENIFKNNKENYLIIDWERSADEAPYLVDKIAFWLGKNHIMIKANSQSSYVRFRDEFKTYDIVDVTLGLYFLCDAKFDLAERLADKWKINNENIA